MTRLTGEEEREMGEEPNRVREKRRERAGLLRKWERKRRRRKEKKMRGGLLVNTKRRRFACSK